MRDFFYKRYNLYINYIKGLFLNDINIDLKDKIVISNMSLSYFNNFFEEIPYQKGGLSNTDILIIKALSKSKILYYNGYPHLLEELKKYFKFYKKIGDKDSVKSVNTGVYKLYN